MVAVVVGVKMIMSARLISAGPRPGYTPIFHDSLFPKGPPRARSGGRLWRLVPFKKDFPYEFQ